MTNIKEVPLLDFSKKYVLTFYVGLLGSSCRITREVASIIRKKM